MPPAARDLLATVGGTLRRRALLKGGERLVVAVSGGPDSLALLHCLHRLAAAWRLDLHVAHFDHRLRPGSADDASFVARQADRLGVPCTQRSAAAPERPPGMSPEEAAREARLSFLEEVAEGVGADAIATGHTLDDRAETVLMRLLQGTGPQGLAGIRPVRGRFVRPLIDARRAQTEAFCRGLHLRARLDPTNDERAFLRNQIRHETIPFLAGTVNERLPEALARLADIMADEDDAVRSLLPDAAVPEHHGGELRLSCETLAGLPVALQRRAIRDAAARAGVELGFAHTEDVRHLAIEGRNGARVDLPGPLYACRRYAWLVIGRAPSPATPAPDVPLVVPGETDLSPRRLRVLARIGHERPAAWPDGREVCVVDAEAVSFPLRVRRRRPGDRFRPLGMARSKKLGDLFTDEKVPVEEREEVPIVVDDIGRPIWVVGYRIDDRMKVRPETTRFLWLSTEEAVR